MKDGMKKKEDNSDQLRKRGSQIRTLRMVRVPKMRHARFLGD